MLEVLSCVVDRLIEAELYYFKIALSYDQVADFE